MRFLWKSPARYGAWLLLCFLLAAPQAQAQTTRAEQLIALRKHKEQMLRPPQEPSSSCRSRIHRSAYASARRW